MHIFAPLIKKDKVHLLEFSMILKVNIGQQQF